MKMGKNWKKISKNWPKWRFFGRFGVSVGWPKFRPNYFGRFWPKFRPKFRFRSYTIKHQFDVVSINLLCPMNIQEKKFHCNSCDNKYSSKEGLLNSVRPKPKFRPKFRSFSAETFRPNLSVELPKTETAKKRHFDEFLALFGNFFENFSNFLEI